jgi:hypothetical protein
MLNNRELALIIWSLIFLGWILHLEKIRKALFAVIKSFTAWKIQLMLWLMIEYVSLIIYFFSKENLWEFSLLKSTIFWFVGTAMVLLLNYLKAYKEGYFKNTALESLKFAVVIEFIINLYVFNLFLELLLVPMLATVVGMLAVSEGKKEFDLLRRILNGFLATLGIVYIIYAVKNIFGDFWNFATIENLKEFLLYPTFTILLLPFIYLLALLSMYENVFMRGYFSANKNENISKYLNRKILFLCHLNLKKLTNFSNNAGIGMRDFSSNEDVDKLIIAFRKFELNPTEDGLASFE